MVSTVLYLVVFFLSLTVFIAAIFKCVVALLKNKKCEKDTSGGERRRLRDDN